MMLVGYYMEVSDLLIRLIILLLPGLISISMIKFLIPRRRFILIDYIIYIVILGFLNYLLLFVVYNIESLICNSPLKKVIFFDALFDQNIAVDIKEILLASVIAIFLGIIIAIIINKGIFYKLFKWLGLTNRTGAVSVWGEIFENKLKGFKKFVYVVDYENDLVYGGQVEKYSYNDDNYLELYLLNVIITKNSKRKKVLRRMPKLYIKLPNDKVVIEIGDDVNG